MLANIKNSAGKSLVGMLCFILRAHVKCRYAYSKTSFCSCGPKSLHMRARQPATGNRRACNCKTRFYHKYNGILQGPDKQKQRSKALFIFRLSPNSPWRISEFTRKNYSGITGLMQNNTLDDLNLPMEKGILIILELRAYKAGVKAVNQRITE